MSVEVKTKNITVSTFLKKKQNNEKISMLTAYDCSTAKYFDEAGVDSILVGDSLGMVVLGYETNLHRSCLPRRKALSGCCGYAFYELPHNN